MADKQMEKQTKKQAFFKKRDLILILVLLVIAGAFWLLMRPGETGTVVEITIIKGGVQTQQTLSLAKDGVYDYEEGILPVHLEVVDGRVHFVNSECPDHDCEGFGWLSRDGEWAACLPAGVALSIREG